MFQDGLYYHLGSSKVACHLEHQKDPLVAGVDDQRLMVPWCEDQEVISLAWDSCVDPHSDRGTMVSKPLSFLWETGAMATP